MVAANDSLADASDMFLVHTMFRREFGLMSGLVRDVPANDTERAAVVADHVAFIGGILNGHHTGEDTHLWPRLRERGAGELAAIVDVMEAQHHAVHDGLENVEKLTQAWRESASAETGEALAGAIDQLTSVIKEHLALEEARVVPLIEKYITAAEYALLPQEAVAKTPPDKLPTIFGMITYEGDPVVIGRLVAELPDDIRPVMSDLAGQAYAAYAKGVYGTATPPRASD